MFFPLFVTLKLYDSTVPSLTSVIFYVGLEGEGSMDIVSKISKKVL